MPDCAKSLFLWIGYELEANQEWLWLNKERYMAENKCSLNTYKKALTALIKRTIIYPVNDNPEYYWVNPRFIWHGNRVKTFKNKLIYK